MLARVAEGVSQIWPAIKKKLETPGIEYKGLTELLGTYTFILNILCFHKTNCLQILCVIYIKIWVMSTV